MIGLRRRPGSPRAGRPLLFLAAVVAQTLAGPPPRGESWLASLADRTPAGSALLAVAIPIGIGRAPALISRLPHATRPLAETVLLASSFDVVGCDRTAAEIGRHLEAGRVQQAAALVPQLRCEPDCATDGPLPDADSSDPDTPDRATPESHVVASETIAALARCPQRYIAPWLSYGLLGLGGTMPLALRPLWQSALGWHSPLAQRWTSARPAPTVRMLADGAAAAVSVAVAPLLGSSLAQTWRAVESAHTEPEVAAMAVLLDRSLLVDGDLINPQAAPAAPQDVRRARRVAWAIAATAGAATIALIFTTRLLGRVGLRP